MCRDELSGFLLLACTLSTALFKLPITSALLYENYVSLLKVSHFQSQQQSTFYRFGALLETVSQGLLPQTKYYVKTTASETQSGAFILSTAQCHTDTLTCLVIA